MRTLTLALSMLVATALPVWSEVSVRRLDVTVDFSDAAKAGETLQALAADLATVAPVVYLDLGIVPEQDAGTQRWNYHVSGDDGLAIGCATAEGDAGVREPRRGDRVSIEAGVVYTHLLLSADLGDPARYPLNSLDCEYAPSVGNGWLLRLRGYFAVIDAAIPTAAGFELRAISPSDAIVAARLPAKVGAP